MATLADIHTAYRAINRTALDADAAASVLASIHQGPATLATYISDLVQNASSTTGAAVAMLAFVTGKTPTSAHLDALKVEADKQLAYYQNMGVANPGLGPFEAIGKALAADPTSGFATKFGAMSDADFIAAAYTSVYEQGPVPEATANLQGELDYFVDLYIKAGFSPAQASLDAKGAVLGQIIGYAFVDPSAAGQSTLDDKVAVFFEKAARGETEIFDAPLPPVQPEPPPGPPMFSVSKDGADAVTFINAGTEVEVSFDGSEYTLSSSGTVTGTATLTGPIASISVPAATRLILDANLASGVGFPGSGTVVLTDLTVSAATLKALEAATAGLLDASAAASITGATVADAQFLLVTAQGTAGDKIRTAADVAVTLTDSSATGSALKAIADATTGFVDATSVTSLTLSTVAQAAHLLVTSKGSSGDTIATASGIVVTLIDTGMVPAADLNAIDAATTGLVSGNSITGISGLSADIKAAIQAAKSSFALSLTALTQVTFTDAATGQEFGSTNFSNNVTVTLADVPGHSISISSGAHGSSSLLTLDGSALTGSNSLTARVSSLMSKPVHITGGAGNDGLRGGLVSDTLIGGAGNDLIEGVDGNDTIDGGEGNDRLFGGEGNDTIIGGAGDDFIDGGNGADTLTGGAGADTFHYFEPMEGGDTITDFDSDDIIMVSRLDFPGYASLSVMSGNGAFTYAMLSSGNGALVLYTDTLTSTTQLFADYNGNGSGYTYTVVTFAGGATVRPDQIHFTDYT
jgi:Ca2+-binding RTX toxin-like protein